MKKILILILVLALAILYFGTLFFVKSSTKDVFANEVAAFSQNPQITATINQQDEGLFSSKVLIDVTIQGVNPVSFTMAQQQFFGPILFTDEGVKMGWYYLNTDLLFPDTLKKAVPADVDVDDLFDIGFFSGFSGAVEGDIYFKGLDFVEDERSMNISGAEIHIDTDFDFDAISGEGHWPGITMKTGEDGFTLNNLKILFTQKRVSGSILDGTAIYEGDVSYGLDQLIFREGESFFRLDKLLMSVMAAIEDNEFMHIDFSLKNDAILVNGENFTDNSMNLAFKRLDLKALEEFGKVSKEVQIATQLGQDVSAYNMQFLNLAMQMVAKGPSIALTDTRINTPDGLMFADLKIDVDHEKVNTQNPMSVMMAVDAILNAEAPHAFFAKKGLAQQIEQYVAMNFVTQEDGKLKINATFQNGQSMLNGQPFQGMPGM